MNTPPRIVVIGGTSGIGLATAALMAARGAAVTVVGRDRARLEAARGSLGAAAGGEVVDAADRAALEAMFARIGTVHHLVLAASGGAGAGLFAAIDAAGLRRGFEAKFWVHWNAAQAALPHMAAGGSITFVTAASSRLANSGTSGLAPVNGDKQTPRSPARSTPPRSPMRWRSPIGNGLVTGVELDVDGGLSLT